MIIEMSLIMTPLVAYHKVINCVLLTILL